MAFYYTKMVTINSFIMKVEVNNMGTNSGMMNFVHQNAATAIGNGAELSVQAHYLTGVVEISGSGTGFTAIFEGKAIDDGAFYPIAGVNLSTLAIGSSTTAKGLYQISLDGLIKFRVRISAIGSGSITVKSRTVN